MKQYEVKDLLDFPSGRLMFILDEAKHEINSIMEDLTESTNLYESLKAMLPHKLAVIQTEFLDSGYSRNEALDRAKASESYEKQLIDLSNAKNKKTALEFKFEACTLTIKAITSITYLKNTELKQGL